MRPRRLLSLYKREKDPEVRDRTVLNVLVERDEVGVAELSQRTRFSCDLMLFTG